MEPNSETEPEVNTSAEFDPPRTWDQLVSELGESTSIYSAIPEEDLDR